MVFSIFDRAHLTADYNHKICALREQDGYRPFDEIESLAHGAKGLLNVVLLQPGDNDETREAALMIIEDYRRHAHHVSAGTILLDLHAQEKPYASLAAVDTANAEACSHLKEAGLDPEKTDRLVWAIGVAADRTRNRVRAEKICLELAEAKRALTWAEFSDKKRKFINLCALAEIPADRRLEYNAKFTASAAKTHYRSVEDFLETLSSEGNTMYFEAIDNMAADICCHLNALGPKELDGKIDAIVNVVTDVKTNNIPESRRGTSAVIVRAWPNLSRT
ncbi:MAG: hypothetical protein PHY92_05685 [Alphaproteobacteria bacterium]|nr:hypothetical protein [Alphaproteobacteria bacterium]